MKTDNMKTKISFLFMILILVVCGVGLYLNFKIAPFNKMILYFTILSNISCFIFYLVTIILKLTNKLKKNNIYYILKGMVTMSITVTMLVYWILIAPTSSNGLYTNYQLACRFVHLYTPILVIMDYLIFGEKGSLKKIYAILWSFSIVIYGALVLIYSNCGGTFINGAKYPYNFLDANKFGTLKIVVSCACIYAVYLTVGFIVYYVDKFMKGMVQKYGKRA